VRHGVVRGQVLAADRQGRATAPLQGARKVEFKRFKITDEDWRNREKWDAYEAAVCDMVDRTSTGDGTVDAGRGQQQVLRPGQGAEDNLRKNRARAGAEMSGNLNVKKVNISELPAEPARTLSAAPADGFVAWFRSVAPYVNLFRGKTFVIAFGGKAILGPLAWTLAYDVNLLAALGIRLVLVHGARPQIEEELREKGLESRYHGRYRVTDAAALDCVIDAVGSVYLELEALLSQGLPDTPMANSTIRVIGGNFITARPVGVIDGVDMQYAGAVRKVDAEGIRAQLGLGNIVLLSCMGTSPTGESFNLAMEEVAEATAVAMNADKLVFLSDSQGATDIDGRLLDELTADAADRLVTHRRLAVVRPQALLALCRARQPRWRRRVHVIGYNEDGTLLRELFSRDGVGTVVTRESLENCAMHAPTISAA
jgi:amino-acid N-acetyltransferase